MGKQCNYLVVVLLHGDDRHENISQMQECFQNAATGTAENAYHLIPNSYKFWWKFPSLPW